MPTLLTESVADSLALSDGLGLGFGFNPGDSNVPTDSAYNSITWIGIFPDGLALSDFVQLRLVNVNLGASANDSLNLSDRALLFAAGTSAISDTLTLSDSFIVVLGVNESFSDSNVPTDSATEVLTPLLEVISVSDTLALSDSFVETLSVVLTEQLSDSLSLSDSATVAQQQSPFFVSVSDTLSLSDFACVVSLPTFNAYVRRYLNDVI